MENEKMDAIDRALLFLAKATYGNHGASVDARIVLKEVDRAVRQLNEEAHDV